jgi:methylated-DNA-[protein]-cysteine S-methyltransferase
MQAASDPAPFIRQTIETPIGGLTLIARGERLSMAEFADCEHRMAKWLRARLSKAGGELKDGEVPVATARAFAAYFEGEIAILGTVEVEFSGTPFQNQVWSALRGIPPGRAFAYGVFAEQLGRPQAARAVGHANGANPLSIVVPCHRLVGAGGALVNYGGGLWRKRWLLDHEQRYAAQS